MSKPLSVLNIEDSENDSDLIARMLKKAGYKITFERVETAGEMLAALKERPWDIIISDHSLPKFDSFSALALLHDEGLDIPFIAVAGTTGQETAVAIMKAGAHDYVPKDDLPRLIQVVERELEQGRIRKERKQIESMYRTLTENSLQGIAIFQGQKMVFANPALSNINGYPIEELMAMSAEQILGLTHPEDRAISQERIRQRLAGENVPPNIELRMIRKDGSIVWVQAFTDRIEYEGQPAILSSLIDISERKQAEEELRASEKRFRALIENGLDDISLLAADGTLIWESPSVVRNLRYASGEFLGHNIFELMHPDDLEPIQSLFAQLIREPGGRQSGTFRLSRKDGTWRWIEAIATNMLNEPSVQAIVINYRDITEQWQAKNTLRESEDRYRDLVENSQDLICTHNMDGLILSANPASARILGYEPGEFIGRNLRDFMAPEVQGHFQYYLTKLRRHGSANGLLLVQTKSGERRIWEYQNTVRSEGVAYPVVRGMARDITERIQAQEKLSNSEKLFRELVDNIEEVFWINDPASQKDIYVSPAYKKVWGHYLNGVDDFFESVQLEDRPIVATALESQRRGEKTDIQYRVKHLDGSVHWVWDRAFPIYDGSGKLKSVAGIATDITDRKHSEEALQESEERFHSLFNRMMDGVYRSKHEGKFVDVNPAMVKMFGYSSREEMLAVDIKNELYFEPEERGSHILDTGQEEMDVYRMRRKDGSEIWVEDHGSYVHNEHGEIIYHEGILRDITERKQAEQELQQAKDFAEKVIQTANVLFLQLDNAGNIQKFNSAAEAITGYSLTEVVGKNWGETLVPRERFPDAWKEFDRLVNLGQTPRDFGNSIITKQGEERHILWKNNLLQEENKIVGIISFGIDITERKRADRILAESEERFRQAIAAADAIPYSVQYVPRHYSFMGEGIEKLAGYSFEEMTPDLLDTLILESNMLGEFKGMPVPEAVRLVREGKSKVSWQCEHRLRTRSGEERWLVDSSIQVLGEDGIPTGSIGIFQDITERKMAEIEIKERTDDTELINSLNEAVNRGESLDSIIKLFAKTLVEVIGSFATTFYLPSRDGNALVMQNMDLTHKTANHIERLIGRPIPQIEVPIREGNYFHRVLHSEHGLLSTDIETIHNWMDGFTETKHLPKAVRGSVRKLIPQINKLMNIHSIISIPLVSEKKIIALFDVCSTKIMTEKDLRRIQKISGQWTAVILRKQAEEALRESEQRYHALFEDMPVSIWEEDFSVVKKHLDSLKEQGIKDFRAYFESNPAAISECNAMIRVLDVNQAALKMYRANNKEELLATVGEVPNERLMAQLREVLIAIAEGTKSFTWEGADETMTNEPIEISLSWLVAPDHEVDFSRVIVTTIDVTARKQAEQALRMSEQRYRALFEDLPISIWEEDFSEAKKYMDSLKGQGVTDFRTHFEHDPEAFLKCATMIRVLDVNQATLKMYRANSKEDLYKSMDEGLSENDVEHILDPLIAISEGKTSHGWEGSDQTVTGEPIQVKLNWTVAPGHEVDFSRVIVTTLDITGRKQAEEALRASEAQFRAIFEKAAIGIALLDHSGHPVKSNSAFEDMLGYDSQELKNMVFTEFTHPEDVAEDLELWQELVTGSREYYQIEKRFIHKSGQIMWSKITSSVVPDAGGKFLFGVRMVEDISERKKVEAESKYQLSELEALYENGLAISKLLEPKQIAQRMVEVMDQKLQWHHAAIRTYDTFTDRLELLALSFPGFDEAQTASQIERINQTINTPDKGLSGWVIRHGEVVRIGKLKDDTRYVETYANIKSGLYVPIKSGGRVIGSIAVESEQENAFTERDEATLNTLANQAAISFINARLYTWLKKELDERLKAEEEIRKLNIELEQRVEERTAQIEATKRRLELATHAGQIGVWEYIPRENKVIWDDRMHMIHQMTSGQFDGTSETWGKIMHPDDLEQLPINRQLAFTKNLLMNNEHRIIWPDGSVHHIMASAVMTYSPEGTPERIIGINMDITDRKQIETSLRESENYARLLFDAVPDPVSVTDADGLIVDVNKEFEKQFSAARDESRGKRIRELGIYPESEIEKRDEYVDDVLQGRVVKPVELDFYVPGDRIHTLELHSYLLKVNGRQLMLNTSHDITAHKKAEEAQRIAKAEMERALRIKNEFLANMSHELRTPLNSILGISESLEEQVAGTLNEKQLKYLGIVRESGRHLLELINDILDLSKIEAGRMELDIHRISVETLCQSTLRMVKELSQKKSLHVSYKVHGDIKIIQADQRRLKQSLVNLLSNAVKFTPEGKEIGLEVKGSPGTNEIEFTVWDQGVGIAAEDMKLLFKPFVQLDAGLAREYQGTGLGLALVAQMINLHGGRVSVESEIGKGSRFTITLPWAPNEQMPKAKVTAELSLPGPRSTEKRNGRILLVEDTDVVVQLISEYLRYKGYEIILAQNGVEGIRLAAQERPDLILMDVMMPIMDGLEATRQIRADADIKNIPIIALTALAMTGDSEKCLAAGMNDYLSKPIQMQDLADMIEKYTQTTLKESDEQ